MEAEARKLNAELRQLNVNSKEFGDKEKEFQKINGRVREIRGEINQTGGAFSKLADQANKYQQLLQAMRNWQIRWPIPGSPYQDLIGKSQKKSPERSV